MDRLFQNPQWLNHVTNLTLGAWMSVAIGKSDKEKDILDPRIFNIPEMEHLRSLAISDYLLGKDGLEELVNSPYLQNLESLSLNGVGIEHGGVQVLIDSPYLQHLEYINFAGTSLTRDERDALRRRFGANKVAF